MLHNESAPQKVIIIQLGMIVRTRIGDTIKAFQDKGISSWQMFYYVRTINDVVNEYRRGQINTAQFKEQLGRYFKEIKKMSSEEFATAWNKMSIVTQRTVELFSEIEELTKEGFEIYIQSSTNPLHIAHIQKQYGRAGVTQENLVNFIANGGVDIPGKTIFSFDVNMLDEQLDSFVIEKAYKNQPNLKATEVAKLYTAVKIPEIESRYGFFGKVLSFLSNPIEYYFRQKDIAKVEKIQAKAKADNKYCLIPFEAGKTLRQSLLDSGFLPNPVKEEESNPGIYHLKNIAENTTSSSYSPHSPTPELKQRKAFTSW